MKNWEEAESGAEERAIETMPRLWAVSLNSGFNVTGSPFASTARRWGTESYQSRNGLFDSANFVSKLCNYALNVHVVPSRLRYHFQRSNPQWYHSGFSSSSVRH